MSQIRNAKIAFIRRHIDSCVEEILPLDDQDLPSRREADIAAAASFRQIESLRERLSRHIEGSAEERAEIAAMRVRLEHVQDMLNALNIRTSGEEWRLQQEWISQQVAHERQRAEMWRRIKTSVWGWLALATLGGLVKVGQWIYENVHQLKFPWR